MPVRHVGGRDSDPSTVFGPQRRVFERMAWAVTQYARVVMKELEWES